MNMVGFIFARGGSKGLPGKNIRNFVDKPLIAWSIQHALEVKRIDRVIVSTDSQEIASIAVQYGAEVPFIRPEELARDDSSEWLAWRHALKYIIETTGKLPNIMVSIPTTAPLRLVQDIENCIDEYEKGNVDIVITITNAHRNPYFNMIKFNLDNTISLVIQPKDSIVRRQDVPVVFDITTVAYVVRPEFVMQHDSIFEGKVRAVNIPIERAIDIDTLHDFQIAEYIIKNKTE